MADGTLKVGTITTSSGSGTITLGQSGETITVPSGATITNSGTATGFGGTNTPNFFASHSSDQTMNDNTITKITYDNEVFDTGSNYDTSNYRYTPGFVGKSFLGAAAWSYDASAQNYSQEFYLYKNGSALVYFEEEHSSSREMNKMISQFNLVVSHNATDYYEVYGKGNTSDGGTILFPTGSGNNATFRNFFYGYKIIE